MIQLRAYQKRTNEAILEALKKYKNVAGAVHFSAIRIKNNQGQVQKTLKKHYK